MTWARSARSRQPQSEQINHWCRSAASRGISLAESVHWVQQMSTATYPPGTDLMRPKQAHDLRQRPPSTFMQLVHTEEVTPLSSRKVQVVSGPHPRWQTCYIYRCLSVNFSRSGVEPVPSRKRQRSGSTGTSGHDWGGKRLNSVTATDFIA